MDSKDLRNLQEAYSLIYEGYGKKGEEKEEENDCVEKKDKGVHNCAKKVCHEQFGEGQCIFGEHAEPDENGFVSHYDVLFGHGVEKNVPVSEMKVLFSESHHGHGKKNVMAHYEAEGKTINEINLFDYLLEYLVAEGYADTNKAALAIMDNMSEEWRESIVESLIDDFEAKKRSKMGYKGPAPSLKTSPGYRSPIETRNDIDPEMRHLFLQAKNKSSNNSQTA